MKTYRVGIIGCGARGRAVARSYHSHPRTQVVGLCDLHKDRREGLGRELGVTALYSDFEEMIRRQAPDIVAIPTPTNIRHDIVMRVLDYGVHVEVEKPIAIRLREIDAMIAKAREKGVTTAVRHQGRVGTPVLAMVDAVQNGKIGEPRYVHARAKGQYGGYGLMNIGCHIAMILHGLVGPCRRLSAIATTRGRPVTAKDVLPSPNGMGPIVGQHITAVMQFDHDVSGMLLSDCYEPTDGYHIEIAGTKGRLYWRCYSANKGALWHLPQPHPTDGAWQRVATPAPEGYSDRLKSGPDDFAFVSEFVDALDSGREHVCNWDSGRHVLEVAMGVFESIAFSKTVTLPQTRRDHPLERWIAESGLTDLPQMPQDPHRWLEEESRLHVG